MAAIFQKFLPKKKPQPIEGKTVPIPEKPKVEKPVEAPATTEEVKPETSQLIAASSQSVGQQRDHNEDALFTLSAVLMSDNRQIPFGLYMVADGMGGHQHGEVASATAIRTMAGFILDKLYLPMIDPSMRSMDQSIQEVMQAGIVEANHAIVRQALGGGTTLTCVLILGDQMTLAHVGDSRAYVISPDGTSEVLTRDHSLVKRLIELGQITPEEALVHPQRNVLYRALGQGEPFDPDVSTTQIPHGCSLLLCSDGLWGVVPQEEIIKEINSAQSPFTACQKLVDMANAAGGPDNISAVLIHLPL